MKKLFIYLLPIAMMLSACSKDGKGIDDGGKEPGKVETKELNLSFDVVMPNPANPNSNQKSSSTYALTDVDENAVAVIDVLAFLENGANMEFAEWAKVAGTSIEENGSISKKKFKVNFTKLVQSPAHKYQFVVIANGRGPVQSLFTGAGAITTGALKDAAMARLKLEGVAGWVSNPTGGGYLHTPMWGEGDATVVTTGLAISDIKLLRMLAKINVTIDENTGVRSKFLLRSIDLYNYNKDGRVVPDAANLASPSKSKVDEPTNIGVHTEGPVEYAATSTTEMVEEIYTFESKVPYVGLPPAVNLNDVICIVIGGEFDTDGRTTYYRVDLAKKNAQGKYDYMNILRNHGYNINVTNVAGSGHDDSYTAFKSRAINIEVDIEAWDESEVNISYDGQYQFGTNKNKLSFFAEGREQTLLVFADHPSGWEIESKPAWITIDPMSDNSASTKEIKVTATAWAGPGDRVDEFIIKAGNIRKPIKVEQSEDAEISLDVTPASITFSKSAARPKSIIVKTFPENLIRTITVTGNIDWLISPLNASGFDFASFQIQPNPSISVNTLSSTITISVIHNGTTVSKAITVNQSYSDQEFDIQGRTIYSEYGARVESFGVRSEKSWMLYRDNNPVSDPDNILIDPDNGPQPASPSTYTPFAFKFTPNTTYVNRKASFYAAPGEIENLDFPLQMVEVTQGHRPPLLTTPTATVDFGTTVASKTISISSNAGWVVASRANNIAEIITANNPAVGDVRTGSTNALVNVTDQLSFTPSVAYVGFPKAGTVLSSYVTLESRNHSTAATSTQTVVLQRNVPQSFEGATITASPAGDLMPLGHNVIASVSTNEEWYVEHSLNTTNRLTFPANSHALRSQTLLIPERPALPEAWTSNRTGVISMWRRGGETNKKTQAFSQLIYTLTASANNIPTTIGQVANSGYYVTLGTTTQAPALRLRIANLVSGAQVWIQPEFSAMLGNRYYQLPANTDWANRSLVFQFEKLGYVWQEVARTTQLGYSVAYSGGLPNPIPKTGGAYDIVFTSVGSPSFSIRAVITGTSTVINTNIIWGSSSLIQSITIPDINSGSPRAITIQALEGSTWVDKAYTTQAAYDWHSVIGYWMQKVTVPTPHTFRQVFFGETICATTYGPGWKVPTVIELNSMHIESLGNEITLYGVSSQNSSYYAAYRNEGSCTFYSLYPENYDKLVRSEYLRCVRPK